MPLLQVFSALFSTLLCFSLCAETVAPEQLLNQLLEEQRFEELLAEDFPEELQETESKDNAEKKLSSSISIGGSGDASDTKTYFINALIGVNSSLAILAGATQTTGAVIDEVDPSSTAVNIGASLKFSENWKITGYYDRWGQSESLISQGAVARISFNSENWSAGLVGSYKRIDLRTNNNSANTFSSQLGGHFGFYGFAPFSFALSHSTYQYKDDVTRLSSDIARFFVPLTVISLSSSFLDRQSAASVSWSRAWFWLELSGSKSVSAVDKTTSTGSMLRVGADYFDHWSFEIEAGQSKNSSAPTATGFGGFVATYLF